MKATDEEKREKAIHLLEELETARAENAQLDKLKDDVNQICKPGAQIEHKVFGEGTIRENTGKALIVDFPTAGEKKLGTFVSLAKGIISVPGQEIDRTLLQKEEAIRAMLPYAQKALEPYLEFLDNEAT